MEHCLSLKKLGDRIAKQNTKLKFMGSHTYLIRHESKCFHGYDFRIWDFPNSL